jgi:hypothetical protein
MKRNISDNDIIIRDNFIKEDERNAGYNLGDLLNMPSLLGIWNQKPHHDSYSLYRMNLLGDMYNDSILSYYCLNRENNDEIVPNINLIVNSTQSFIEKNTDTYKHIFDIVKDPENCCVHIRNGDCRTEDDYINLVINLSHKFKKIIILSGVHLDTYFSDNENKIKNFKNTINSILEKNENIFILLESVDIHLSIMAKASNLLLHKGGFSCLGSIVSSGNLFITKYFGYNNCNIWKNMVNKEYTILNI